MFSLTPSPSNSVVSVSQTLSLLTCSSGLSDIMARLRPRTAMQTGNAWPPTGIPPTGLTPLPSAYSLVWRMPVARDTQSPTTTSSTLASVSSSSEACMPRNTRRGLPANPNAPKLSRYLTCQNVLGRKDHACQQDDGAR
jgi:hypothetical protein